jgi:hypothetical protein
MKAGSWPLNSVIFRKAKAFLLQRGNQLRKRNHVGYLRLHRLPLPKEMVAQEKEVARGKWRWEKDDDRRKTRRRDSSGNLVGIRIESIFGLELGLLTLRCEDHPCILLPLSFRGSRRLQARHLSITPTHVHQLKDEIGFVCIGQSLLVSSLIRNNLFGEAWHTSLACAP